MEQRRRKLVDLDVPHTDVVKVVKSAKQAFWQTSKGIRTELPCCAFRLS
jgi:hypothetical protein